MQNLPKYGIGTYKSAINQEQIIKYAISKNVKLIDTAPNYNDGQSQIFIGNILKSLDKKTEKPIISSKAGFFAKSSKIFTKQSLNENKFNIIGNHCMDVKFIDMQIQENLEQLHINSIDILFLHNPETQLKAISKKELLYKIRDVFEILEEYCSKKMIKSYGISTWDGFGEMDNGKIILEEILDIAEHVNKNHNFKYIQLPNSLVKYELLSELLFKSNGFLETANKNKIKVLSSSPLHHGQLPKIVQQEFANYFKSGITISQFCLLFVNSFIELDTILVGASSENQLNENLLTFTFPNFCKEELAKIIELLRG